MKHTETNVGSFTDTLYALTDGTSLNVIQLRADATGGFGRTAKDDKSTDWTVPAGQKIDSYEVKILTQSGDRNYIVALNGDTSVHAEVHAKGHPKGEAHNHSYIEIQVWVVVSPRV